MLFRSDPASAPCGSRVLAGGVELLAIPSVFVVILPTADRCAEEQVLAQLPRSERIRIASFERSVDRIRSGVGRLVAAAAVSDLLDVDLSSVAFNVVDRFSKPLCNYPATASIAHSGNVVMAAASRGVVGVDVEQLIGVTLGARRVLSSLELAWMDQKDERDQPQAFLRLWTAKEALLKALGIGLRLDPRLVDLSKGLPGPSEEESNTRWHISVPQWGMQCMSMRLDLDEAAYLVAIATSSENYWNIRQLSLDDFLRRFAWRTGQ